MTLDLRANPIGPSGAAALLTSSRLSRLTSLSLATCAVGFTAWESAVNAPSGPRLSHLDLSGNELGDVGTALLTRWSGLVHVRSLDLSRNEIGDDGARALAQAASLGGLRQLWLNGNHISEAGKRTLSTAPHLRRAFVLQMQDNASPMPNIRR
jgi:hypothetical protein